MEKPLVDQTYILEKFPGKGGWTYVVIPEVVQDKNTPFGWVKVKGSVDGYSISRYNLMPMGQGRLMLPVKAEIRKKINKKEGDEVRVVLYPDFTPLEIPEELKECLIDADAMDNFMKLNEGERKGYINWIYSAKRIETKVDRMTKTIDRVLQGRKFYEQM